MDRSDEQLLERQALARARWLLIASGGYPMDSAFAGLLGWEEQGGHVSRHGHFAQERGLLCLDVASGRIVKVADYAKQRYWGERALLVAGRAPQEGAGFSWERDQSSLAELAPELQGADSAWALQRLAAADARRAASRLAAAWLAFEQARQIEGACGGSPPEGQASRPPRL